MIFQDLPILNHPGVSCKFLLPVSNISCSMNFNEDESNFIPHIYSTPKPSHLGQQLPNT